MPHKHAAAAYGGEGDEMVAVMGELQTDQRVVLRTRMQDGNTCKVGAAQQLVVKLQHEDTRGRETGESLAVGEQAFFVVMRKAVHAVS
jgi:hypothetical protein